MKTCWEWTLSSTVLALGSEWEVNGQLQRQTTLTSKKDPNGHWIGGLAKSRAVLDAMEKRKIF
jgi:hypothetical protein